MHLLKYQLFIMSEVCLNQMISTVKSQFSSDILVIYIYIVFGEFCSSLFFSHRVRKINAMSRYSLKTDLYILNNCASQVMSFLRLSTPSAFISGFSLSSCHVSSHSRKTTALLRVFSKPAWRLSPPYNTLFSLSLSVCECEIKI